MMAAGDAGPGAERTIAPVDDPLLIDELKGFRAQLYPCEADGEPIRLYTGNGEDEQTTRNLRAVLWDAAVRIKALDAELAAARADVAKARAAALEEAASWHDAQIQSGHCGEENAEAAARRRTNRHHELSAAAIRAAALAAPQPSGVEVSDVQGRSGDAHLPRGEKVVAGPAEGIPATTDPAGPGRALRAALEIVENEVERVSVYGLPHGRVVLDEDELRVLASAGRRALAAGSADGGEHGT